MQRTATTKLGLGLAGALTASLAFAPAAFATGDTGQPPVEQEQTPFLDLMYASPYKDLKPGDSTTVVIAQTLPASYTLTSYMANGNKCFYAYDAPAADHTKSGGESDADLVVRSIVATSDENGNGVDDWYEGATDENGVAACKIKATDEFGNMDWKYIYINVGVAKTPKGDDFDNGATTTVVEPPATTAAPATTAPGSSSSVVVPSSVLPTTVAPTTTAAAGTTLPRTGSATWVEALIGSTLAAAGAGLLMFSRRRAQAAEVRSNG